mmetsp:Transcript_10758/g.33950  ORF Transcript_10758/g.33950 Transcript_10758/m.33950 type:complete len:343 (+) Transcript_10758:873-1901(+)
MQSNVRMVGSAAHASRSAAAPSACTPFEPMCSAVSGGRRSEMARASSSAPSSPSPQPCTRSEVSGSASSAPCSRNAPVGRADSSSESAASAGAIAERTPSSRAAAAPSATWLASSEVSATAGETKASVKGCTPLGPKRTALSTSLVRRRDFAHSAPSADAPSSPSARLLTSRLTSCETAAAAAMRHTPAPLNPSFRAMLSVRTRAVAPLSRAAIRSALPSPRPRDSRSHDTSVAQLASAGRSTAAPMSPKACVPMLTEASCDELHAVASARSMSGSNWRCATRVRRCVDLASARAMDSHVRSSSVRRTTSSVSAGSSRSSCPSHAGFSSRPTTPHAIVIVPA